MPKWRYNSNNKSGIAQHVLHKGRSLNLPHENLTCLSQVHWHTGLSQRRLEFVLLTPSQPWRLYQVDNCCETIPYRKRKFPNKNEKQEQEQQKTSRKNTAKQYSTKNDIFLERNTSLTKHSETPKQARRRNEVFSEKKNIMGKPQRNSFAHQLKFLKKETLLICFCSMLRTLWQPAVQQFSKPIASGSFFARQITKSKTRQVSVLTRGHSYWNRSRRVARSIEIKSEAGLSLLHSPTSLSISILAVAQVVKNDPMPMQNPTSLSISFPAVTQVVKNDPMLIQDPTSLSISVTLKPFLMNIFENGQ